VAKTIDQYRKEIEKYKRKLADVKAKLELIPDFLRRAEKDAVSDDPGAARRGEKEADRLDREHKKLSREVSGFTAKIEEAEAAVSQLREEAARREQRAKIEVAEKDWLQAKKSGDEWTAAIAVVEAKFKELQSNVAKAKTSSAAAGLKDNIELLTDRPRERTARLAMSKYAPELALLLGFGYFKNGYKVPTRETVHVGVISKLKLEDTSKWYAQESGNADD